MGGLLPWWNTGILINWAKVLEFRFPVNRNLVKEKNLPTLRMVVNLSTMLFPTQDFQIEATVLPCLFGISQKNTCLMSSRRA